MIVPHPKTRAIKLTRHIDRKTNKIATKERIIEWLDRLIEINKDNQLESKWNIDTRSEYLKIK